MGGMAWAKRGNSLTTTLTLVKTSEIITSMGATPNLTVVTATLPIDTPKNYASNMWDILKILALCMHTHLNVSTEQGRLLHNMLTIQTKKQKGVYTIQLPKLLRVESSSTVPDSKEVYIKIDHDLSTDPPFYTGTLLVPKTCGIQDGLYTSSMSFVLTNLDWDLYHMIDNGHTWGLEEVFFNIPRGHPVDCSAHFELTLMQYTAPLPPARGTGSTNEPAWSFSFSQLHAWRDEFKKTFLSQQ